MLMPSGFRLTSPAFVFDEERLRIRRCVIRARPCRIRGADKPSCRADRQPGDADLPDIITDEDAVETLRSLDQMGIRITIDDFGTGYSSLSRLNSFPFHSLKVDMSFVRMLDDPQQPSNRILEVIQAMAEALDLHTTAEGVETDAQRRWLEANGFHWGQGYLVARPMPLAELGPWLAERHADQWSSTART